MNSIEKRIAELEKAGMIDPRCPTCQHAYEYLRACKPSLPFGPPHTASAQCQSGKHPHCACSACF